ncbi:hypothetical protein LCM10_05060 [Rossellomorea aquimaris]|uniref:hypothetical protein n=1 Tax=Rossellomorea aquimaris TaxID=189382 RepID=UPI001CD23F14|nr:hypothetical protein [Rossellomorea aquimaris]MCA1054349.1 hypothetical protein [Rossellomorea aquimaris]
MEFFSLLVFQVFVMLLLVVSFAVILFNLHKRLNVLYPLLVSVLAAIGFLFIFNVENLLSVIALGSNLLFSVILYVVAVKKKESF